MAPQTVSSKLVVAEIVRGEDNGAVVAGLDGFIAKRQPILLVPAASEARRPSPQACAELEKRLRADAVAAGFEISRRRQTRDPDHPLHRPTVQEHFPWVITVVPRGSQPPSDEVIVAELCRRFCAWRAKAQRHHLHILGDESGLSGGSGVYVLVVARPQCGLPVLPFMHAATGHGPVNRALEALADAQEAGHAGVLIVTLEKSPLGVPVAGDEALHAGHQVIWDLVVPLMVEIELCRAPSDRQITAHICLERVGPVKAGSLPTFVSHLQDLIRSRGRAWPPVTFPETAVLAKGEHGWLAFADVVANAYLRKRGEGEVAGAAVFDRIMHHALVVPFREHAMRRVLDLLDDWAPQRAREFLANLARGLDAEDFADYGVFLDAAIRDAVAQLTSPEWRDLCDALSEVLENTPRRQAGARRILRELTPERIAALPTPRDQAGALIARLHAANQSGEADVADSLIDMWRCNIAPSPAITSALHDAFAAQRANHAINNFSFAAAAAELSAHVAARGSQAAAPLLGTLLQCHAFLADDTSFDALLPRYTDALGLPSDTDLRRACYLAHAMLERDQPMRAFVALAAGAGLAEEAAGTLGFEAPELDRAVAANPFFHVAVLKTAWFMARAGVGQPKPAARFVPASERLPAGHPAEGLAYWGALVAQIFGRPAEMRALADALVASTAGPYKARDVAGVRLAAYWGSLAALDIVAGGDALDEFRSAVLARSTASTRAWVALPATEIRSWAARHHGRLGIGPLLPLTFSNL